MSEITLSPATPETPPLSPNSYDEVPYESHPFAQTHPSRLFVVGTLFGMRPMPVQRCRVLELGSAAGGNIIPMAEYLPDSEFVGVDYSARQIKDGNEIVSAMGLKNVTLKHLDIMDVGPDLGKFDYVICHGVFSWVEDKLKNKILDICNTMMNQNGIAYISYNTYPGWHMRGMIRDMMRYHSGRFNTPKERAQQARALLDFLSQSVKQEGSAYTVLLKQEVETLRHQADHYLYHEHLEEVNHPLYFHQFAERAAANGLKYLGEARVGTMVTGNFGPEIEKTLKMLATDQIQVEQYMDFLRNRMFRESLLVKNKVNPNWAVNPECLRVMHVASGARPMTAEGKPMENVNISSDEAVSYRTPSGMSMSTPRPLLKSAMHLLQQAFPGSIPFDSLRKQAREALGGDPSDAKVVAEDTQVLAVGLLNCYMGSDLVELNGMPINFIRTPGDKPAVSKLTCLLAERGQPVPNRRHEVVRLNDLDKQLIPLLDGENDKATIVQKLTEVAQTGALNIQKDGNTLSDPAEIKGAIEAIIDQALQNVAQRALIVE